MASCALNYFNSRSGGQEPLNAKYINALKSFKAQLAMHYPPYTMVNCELFAAQYLTGRVKMAVISSVNASILPASNQTQR